MKKDLYHVSATNLLSEQHSGCSHCSKEAIFFIKNEKKRHVLLGTTDLNELPIFSKK